MSFLRKCCSYNTILEQLTTFFSSTTYFPKVTCAHLWDTCHVLAPTELVTEQNHLELFHQPYDIQDAPMVLLLGVSPLRTPATSRQCGAVVTSRDWEANLVLSLSSSNCQLHNPGSITPLCLTDLVCKWSY